MIIRHVYIPTTIAIDRPTTSAAIIVQFIATTKYSIEILAVL